MLFKVVVLFVGFLQIVTIPRVYTTSSTKGLCTMRVSYLVSQYVPYTETYLKRIFNLFYKTKERLNYKKSYSTAYQTISICCPMYTRLNNGICAPLCTLPCVNGYCSSPGQCTCSQGYVKSKNDTCEPLCPATCQPGKCHKPDICTCDKGYQFSEHNTCEPICDVDCKSQNAFCSAPNECTCNESYTRAPKSNTGTYLNNSICEPICEDGLSICAHGVCAAPGVCSCDSGYFLTKDRCVLNCSAHCLNRGHCTEDNVCQCDSGYKLLPNGTDCEPVCESSCANGMCVAPNECSCDPGYYLSSNRTTCELIFCEDGCHNGECIGPNRCICNEGYSPVNASTCEPVCNFTCANGYCGAPNECICNHGYNFTKNYTNICEPFCEQFCGDNEICDAPNTCSCIDGYEIDIEKRCVPVCTSCENGNCTKPEVCECNEGYVPIESENKTVCEPYCENCNNGTCTAPGECSCDQGFAKGTGNETGGCVRVCENDCNEHGSCNVDNATCECWHGWTGPYCNESTFCVLVLHAEHTNVKIEDHMHDETITTLFESSPLCNHSCFDDIGNDTLNCNLYENKVACLTNPDLNCDTSTLYLTKAPNYVIMGGIAGTAIVAAGTVAATYLVIRNRKKGIAPTVSIQGQDMLLPEDDNL